MKINDFSKVLNGYAFKSSNYVDNGYRVIRITNVQSGYLEDDKPVFYKQDNSLNKYELKENDILISLTGNVGRCAIVTNDYLPAYLNQRVCCLRVDEEKVIPKFLYYILNSRKFEFDCINSSQGIAQLNMSTEWLKDYDLEIPSFEKQNEIIHILDKIYKNIDIKKNQIIKLDKLIKSQFVEMFGDPNKINDNEKIELKTLILNSNNGMARRGNNPDGSIVLRLVELQRNFIDYSNVNRINLDEKEKKKYLLTEGDVLFARVNGNPDNVGRCAFFQHIEEDVYHNDHIIRVKFDLQKINPVYLCTLLNDEYGKMEFKNKIKTSAGQYTISQDGIEKVRLFLPQIEQQNKFAEFVKQVDKQKFEFEKQLKKLEELQASLMQEYFG